MRTLEKISIIICLTIVLGVCIGSAYQDYLVYYDSPQNQKVSVQLNLNVVRNGKIVSSVTKEDDLLLHNFALLLFYLQQSIGSPSPYAWNPIDLAGDMRWIITTNTTSSYTIADTTTIDEDVGCFFGIGSNVSSASKNDFHLVEIELSPEPPFVSTFQTYADGFSLSSQATIEAVDPSDMAEAGLGARWCDNLGFQVDLLLVRDVFAPVDVEQYDLVTISYRFIFGSGYTNNYMTFLLYLLKGVSNGGSASIYLVDVAGISQEVQLYRAVSGTNWFGYGEDGGDYGIYALMGTGSTAFSRTQYRLQGSGTFMVAANIIEPEIDENNDAIVMQGLFVPTAAVTIYEAGIYRATRTTNGMKYFMFMRLTFTGKYVGAGITVQTEFTQSL